MGVVCRAERSQSEEQVRSVRVSFDSERSSVVQEVESKWRQKLSESESQFQQVLTQSRHEWELKLTQVTSQLSQAEAALESARQQDTSARASEVQRLSELLRLEQERRAASEHMVQQLHDSSSKCDDHLKLRRFISCV